MSSREEQQQLRQAKRDDQAAKSEMLIATVQSYCHLESEIAEFRAIAASLEQGEYSITAKALSGGKTNYSYKVSCGSTNLFAKICFNRALWNPDPTVPYDLARVDNEFEIMKRFASLMMQGQGQNNPPPVAKPYVCHTVDEHNKILIVEWAPSGTEEQWSNQFIDGSVDSRVVIAYAKALAKLHSVPVDPLFNDNVRACVRSLFPVYMTLIENLIMAEYPLDKCAVFWKEVGVDAVKTWIQAMDDDYMCRDVLCHSDTHSFNVLVEPKTSYLEDFGPTGHFAICDWEMAFCGPLGLDGGTAMSWCICCSLVHAVKGHMAEARSLMETSILFWDTYVAAMNPSNEDDAVNLWRKSLAWAAYFVFGVIYMLGFQNECFPFDGVPDEDVRKAKGSIGYIGCKLWQFGFMNGEPQCKSVDRIKEWYQQLLESEFAELAQVVADRRPAPRRGSLLRASGRRVSDAGVMEETADVLRRAGRKAPQRPSIYGGLSMSSTLWEELAMEED